MINYSLDKNTRPAVYFILAALSLGFSISIGPLVDAVDARWIAPSAFTIFGISIFAFDYYLWKVPGINSLLGIPNVGGTYSGTVERGTFDTPSYECYDVVVIIKQTWTKIDMVLNSNDTISHLRTCGFFIANGDAPFCQYTYLVKDMGGDAGRPMAGEGAAELYIYPSDSPMRLKGRYYSTKARAGIVSLERRHG